MSSFIYIGNGDTGRTNEEDQGMMHTLHQDAPCISDQKVGKSPWSYTVFPVCHKHQTLAMEDRH